MVIVRQHEATEITEIYGAICTAFVAVATHDNKPVGPLYIQLAQEWHRFYLDAGLLFWQQGAEPDPDDDILEGEHYWNIGTALGVVGIAIQEARMDNSTLTLSFHNGARLVLSHPVRAEETEVVVLLSGQHASATPLH
jgi:hypothetical protein